MGITPQIYVVDSHPRNVGVAPFMGDTVVIDDVTLPVGHEDDDFKVAQVTGENGLPGIAMELKRRDVTHQDLAKLGRFLKEDHFDNTLHRMSLTSDILEDYDDLSEVMAAVDVGANYGLRTTYYSDGSKDDRFRIRYPGGGVEVSASMTGDQMRFTQSGVVQFERNVQEMVTPNGVDPDDNQLMAIKEIRGIYCKATRYGYQRDNGQWVIPYGWESMD